MSCMLVHRICRYEKKIDKLSKLVEGDHLHAFYKQASLTEIFPIVNADFIFNHSNLTKERERERVSPRLSCICSFYKSPLLLHAVTQSARCLVYLLVISLHDFKRNKI